MFLSAELFVQFSFFVATGIIILTLMGKLSQLLFSYLSKTKPDQEGDPFDRSTHRFGMAYTSARYPTPFYPVNFRTHGYGSYAECIDAKGERYTEPQYITQMVRAPDHDMVIIGDHILKLEEQSSYFEDAIKTVSLKYADKGDMNGMTAIFELRDYIRADLKK